MSCEMRCERIYEMRCMWTGSEDSYTERLGRQPHEQAEKTAAWKEWMVWQQTGWESSCMDGLGVRMSCEMNREMNREMNGERSYAMNCEMIIQMICEIMYAMSYGIRFMMNCEMNGERDYETICEMRCEMIGERL